MKTITLNMVPSANLDALETAASLGIEELFYQLRPSMIESVSFEDAGEDED